MSNYTGSRTALGYYGTIQAATAARASTAQVWANLQAAALATAEWLEGYPPGAGAGDPKVIERAKTALHGVTVQDVNQLRAIAGASLRAKMTLMAASDDEAIIADMISRPPNAVTG